MASYMGPSKEKKTYWENYWWVFIPTFVTIFFVVIFSFIAFVRYLVNKAGTPKNINPPG